MMGFAISAFTAYNKSMERIDDSYIASVVKQKPRDDDPREIAIVAKLKQEIFQKKWAKDIFTKIKNLQIEYFKETLASIDKPEHIHDKTQNMLRNIASFLRANIVEGASYLETLPKNSPVFIFTNHFGAYKLTSFNPREKLGTNIEGYDWICPPFSHASLAPIASALGNNLYFIVADFPAEFGIINTAAGFFHVSPRKVETGRAAALQKQIEGIVKNHQNVAIVNFPEGGTSGKYNGLGPYDLDNFRTGGYVIAALLKIPVIPAAQYFHPDTGFMLKVFEPFIPAMSNLNGYRRYADKNKKEIQSWLHECKSIR